MAAKWSTGGKHAIHVEVELKRTAVMTMAEEILDRGLRNFARDVVEDAQQSMEPARTRKTRGGRTVFVPAPVGDPPSIRSGRLQDGIQSAARDKLEWIAGPTEPYGVYHEKPMARNPEHPFMLPALRRVSRRTDRAFFRRP